MPLNLTPAWVSTCTTAARSRTAGTRACPSCTARRRSRRCPADAVEDRVAHRRVPGRSTAVRPQSGAAVVSARACSSPPICPAAPGRPSGAAGAGLAAKGLGDDRGPHSGRRRRQILDRRPRRPANASLIRRSISAASIAMRRSPHAARSSGAAHVGRQPALVRRSQLAPAIWACAARADVNASPPVVADPPAPARRRRPAAAISAPGARAPRRQVAALVLAEQPAVRPRRRRRRLERRRRCSPASAISASATARPPSERSWQAATTPAAIRRARSSPWRRSAARSTGGGAPSSRPQISRR